MFNEIYDQLKNTVEENLIPFLPETSPESRLLYDAMKYSLEAGGKRIRPVLLLASCLASGGQLQEAMPFACAMEFIHTFSLIHDDHPSMDNDDLRRGKPTNHKVFGDDMAILAGDALFNSAMDVMFDAMASCGTEVDALLRRIRAAREISYASGIRGMAAGQTADIHPEKIEAEDSEKLLYIHRNKTGALIQASVRAGAILGGADEETLESFTVYAAKIGVAFQIVDDILDVVGDVESLGKNTGMDESLGKLTYPAIYGLEVSQQKAKEATDTACNALKAVRERTVNRPEDSCQDTVVYFDFLEELALDLLNRIS